MIWTAVIHTEREALAQAFAYFGSAELDDETPTPALDVAGQLFVPLAGSFEEPCGPDQDLLAQGFETARYGRFARFDHVAVAKGP